MPRRPKQRPIDFEQKIINELEDNPALEEGNDTDNQQEEDFEDDTSTEKEEDINLDEYLRHDDIAGYKIYIFVNCSLKKFKF